MIKRLEVTVAFSGGSPLALFGGLFSLIVVTSPCFTVLQRHVACAGNSRRLSRYRFAKAKAVNSREVFFASPR